jgi:hypothetical protein
MRGKNLHSGRSVSRLTSCAHHRRHLNFIVNLRCRQRTEPAAQPPLPRRGLRDQILQLAPGRRKEGVKTGASDSAWLWDVLDRTERDVARVLFISEDKDLRAALAAWQYAEPLTRSLKDLLEVLTQ